MNADLGLGSDSSKKDLDPALVLSPATSNTSFDAKRRPDKGSLAVCGGEYRRDGTAIWSVGRCSMN